MTRGSHDDSRHVGRIPPFPKWVVARQRRCWEEVHKLATNRRTVRKREKKVVWSQLDEPTGFNVIRPFGHECPSLIEWNVVDAEVALFRVAR